MPISVSNPTVVEQKTANYFEIAHYDVSNREEGPHLAIWWNAYTRTVTGEGENQLVIKDLVKNFGPAEIAGEDLVAICADALSRANTYVTAGQPAGIAYQLGQRDAIYAALQAATLLPQAN